MAVHKIKAKDDNSGGKKVAPKTPTKTSEQKAAKKTKNREQLSPKKHNAIVRFLLTLTTPFRAIGRYFRDSWRELRLVKWPTRKLTWKMTIAVIVYVLIFAGLIAILDILFTLLFSNIIK